MGPECTCAGTDTRKKSQHTCIQLIRHLRDDPLAPLSAIWCTLFDCSQVPTHTLVTYRDQLYFMPSDQLRGNDHTYWGMQHASHIKVWHQWRLHIRDSPVLAVEDLSSPRDEHLQYSHRVIVPESPYQIGVIVGLRGMLVDCQVAGHVEDGLLPLLTWVGEDIQTSDVEERWVRDLSPHPSDLGFSSFQGPPPPGTESSSFQAPPPPGIGSSSFQAPPPLGTISSSTPHSLYRQTLHPIQMSMTMSRRMW
ncbi:hypothetical protein M9H77_27455 [Catharanthus roseus]|uniref:Uncharacterized protein n=1 Tax=Catharanthus roseus TaxID=4058 RepID=A0ACC0ACH9_CATRO|nr:hypothetical protein M9H77_27455 [Catharanthus roseus]